MPDEVIVVYDDVELVDSMVVRNTETPEGPRIFAQRNFRFLNDGEVVGDLGTCRTPATIDSLWADLPQGIKDALTAMNDALKVEARKVTKLDT
jgi:hypothetical protein